jgi:hypothetical protein
MELIFEGAAKLVLKITSLTLNFIFFISLFTFSIATNKTKKAFVELVKKYFFFEIEKPK